MEERPVAAVLILASVISLGHAAAAPLLADARRRQDDWLSHFSSNPYLSQRSLQPGLQRFFSHPSPPPSSPSRPLRRWRSPARPQRPVGRGSKRRPQPPVAPPKRAKPGAGWRWPPPPPPPRLKPFRSAHSRQPVGRRYGGGRKVNVGRMIGCLFVGVVVLLQVALGVFLGVRWWQISKLERRSS